MDAKLIHQYLEAKYGTFEEIELSKEEFLEVMMHTGMTREDAELQFRVSSTLESYVLVGTYRIKTKGG